MPRKLGGPSPDSPEPNRSEEQSDFLRQLLDEDTEPLEEELDTTFLADHLSDRTLPTRPADEEPAELELDFPDTGSSSGYEEFATIPTSGYTDAEAPYAGIDLSAYSAGSVPADTFTGGARRSKKNRTGSIATVPLREQPADQIEDRDDRAASIAAAAAHSRSIATVWVFCGFLLFVLALFIFTPKVYFSDEERSVLAAEPTLSAKTVFDGSFEEDAETYMADHFPFRRFWIGLNSYYNLYSGRPLINGVYVGEDEYFIEEPAAYDPHDLELNTGAIRSFVERENIPASIICVPAAGYIEEDKLPRTHLPYHDEEIMRAAEEQLSGAVEWIDLAQDLKAEAQVEQVYYRTDHHWTSISAYIAYMRYAQAHGFAPVPADQFTISYYDGFKGTTYAKVLLYGIKPDMIQLWERPGNYEVESFDADKPESQITDGFFDMSALTSYDPYMVFFGGNHSLVHITNKDEKAEGTLLVIKDSYANCLVPFIAPHYSEIYMVDPRYYKEIGSLCEQKQFDEVLFVYSTGNLVNDRDLSLIDM